MLVDKLQEQSDLTPQEQVVASFILENMKMIPSFSAQGLAGKSFTSKATVVRLCQKLGFSGFQEFKLQLLAEWHEKQRLDALLSEEPISSHTNFEDLLDILPQIYDKALTNTRFTLRKQQLPKLINFIEKSDQIIFLGTGISYISAQAAAFKFSNLGLQATAMESLNKHFLALNKDKKTVFFLISFTGKHESILQMARYLKQEGFCPIVGLVGPYYEQLKPYCHEIIELPNRESLIGLDVVSSNISLTYIIDLLFSMYLAKTYDKQVKVNLSNRPK